MTVITPYESSVRPDRTPGFGSLLRAEWTKLRTVRGFVIGLLLAAALPVVFTQLGHASCSIEHRRSASAATARGPAERRLPQRADSGRTARR